MLAPSGWLMKPAAAVRLKLLEAPLRCSMPGAAACAQLTVSDARTVRSFAFIMWRIPALLIADHVGVELAHAYLGHQAAKVLGVVRQVIEVGRVQVEVRAARVQRAVARIQDHVERFTAAQSDR